ncbi:MAG TPA: formyltransferase family protein, partial [Lacipirellulaceae bacterium]|nr:formyltransferase family protein [Lacipirellulaceae bacterium]
LGGIAVHESLLPRLRGFAPTNWSLILGHDKLGATLFQLTDSVDAGDIFFQQAIMPRPLESYESVQNRIAELSVDLFTQFLEGAKAGTLTARRQDEAAATYTCPRIPEDGEIDWCRSSDEIERLIRALAPPAPGAFTYLAGEPLYLLAATAVEKPRNYEGRIPGRVVERHLDALTVDVLCGAGALRIARVRTATGRETAAASVIRNVRESLGLNYSREIVALRERVNELEAYLRSRQDAPNWKKTA